MATFSRRVFLSTAAGIAAGGIAACSSSTSRSSTQKQGLPTTGTAESLAGKTIRVGTFKKSHVATPLFWPRFAPKGLTVQVTTLSSESEMNRALEAGKLDFATFAVVNGFVDAARGVGSRIIGTGARQGCGLIVRRESSFLRVQDLAGKRISVKAPSFPSLVLLSLFNEAGMRADTDAQLLAMEWNDMPVALERGEVDAYMGAEPNPSRSVASGVGRRLIDPYTTPLGQLNSCLWAAGTIVKSDPALCRAAVDLQRQAAEHLSPGGNNDTAVWKDLAVGQFGLDELVSAELIGNVGAVWQLDRCWLDQIRAAGAKMSEFGLLQAEPDYDTLVLREFQPRPTTS